MPPGAPAAAAARADDQRNGALARERPGAQRVQRRKLRPAAYQANRRTTYCPPPLWRATPPRGT
ncbi:hypothetical protein GCM10010307_02250 [Streptomyces vastus]|uniref:Uncharacterized protein n=1 Tax=Streptomyces vastus TaxID=285451 RepID=A0ABN3Q8E3_9ACTN